MIRSLKLLFLVVFLNNFSFASNEYGWVEDIVGIDENAFNYADGSDPDLELYVKNLFFFEKDMRKHRNQVLRPPKMYRISSGIQWHTSRNPKSS